MKRLLVVALLAIPAIAVAGDLQEKNKELAQRFLTEVYNEQKLDRIPKYVGESFVDRSPGAPATAKGPEHVIEQAKGSFKMIPDLKFEALRMVAEGDLVTIHWRSTGTSAEAKPINVEGISIFRYDDGMIVESWDIVDRITLLRQMGFKVTPPEK